jgi:ketosteroid isomerase-like protein
MRWLFLCAALPLMGCSSEHRLDVQGIRAVLAEQEAAWDRGDIPGFMEGYADSVCFISPKRRTCGKQAVMRNYLSTYPDQRAMGDLTFTVLDVEPAGPGHAWMAGAWELARAADTLRGGFSLLWERQKAGWRIIRDYSH